MKPTTYRELQAALKTLRNEGYNIQVKLNASFETLQAGYNRLTQANLEPTIEMTTEEFNEWVGFPTDSLAIKAELKPRVNIGNLQQNEGFSSRQNSETFTKQRFKSIELNIGSNPRTTQPETRQYYNKQPFQAQKATHNACISKVLNIPAKSIYWVDGSELGQKLDSTQVQALRNLQNGLRLAKAFCRRLKAFAEGFAEAEAKTRSLKVA